MPCSCRVARFGGRENPATRIRGLNGAAEWGQTHFHLDSPPAQAAASAAGPAVEYFVERTERGRWKAVSVRAFSGRQEAIGLPIACRCARVWRRRRARPWRRAGWRAHGGSALCAASCRTRRRSEIRNPGIYHPADLLGQLVRQGRRVQGLPVRQQARLVPQFTLCDAFKRPARRQRAQEFRKQRPPRAGALFPPDARATLLPHAQRGGQAFRQEVERLVAPAVLAAGVAPRRAGGSSREKQPKR